jgi:hypothetical protein
MERKSVKRSLEKPKKEIDNFITMELIELVFVMGSG